MPVTGSAGEHRHPSCNGRGMTNRKDELNENDEKTAGRKDAAATKEIASSGDNRRLGDTDGNKSAGDARSPGADEPK